MPIDSSHLPALVVKKTRQRGRGVYTKKAFKKGRVIETCHVIEVSPRESDVAVQTVLNSYWFLWGGKGRGSQRSCAIALGFGSLYNHSPKPNAVVRKQVKDGVIHFVALRDILPGEEITIDYSTNARPLVFVGREWDFAEV
jgi:SET domain-containing protein